MLGIHGPYRKEKEMEKKLLAMTVLALCASAGSVAPQPAAATMIPEKSVECGTKD
jgi:hypothetical protein